MKIVTALSSASVLAVLVGLLSPVLLGAEALSVAAPDGKMLSVEALEDGLFRVRLAADGAAASESLLNRYGMIEGDWKGPAAFRRSASGFETAEAKVSVADGVMTLRSKVSAANVTVAPKVVGKGFSVRFSLADGERIYGLGDASRRGIMRRPGKYDIWVSNNTCNIPIPMTLSSAGWGLLLNCTWRHAWDVGEADPSAMTCTAEEGPVDFYVFVGRGYPALLDAYTRLTGRSALLPAFGYGLSFVCNQHIDQFNLVNDAMRFREYDLPCDVLGLEPGWMEKFYDRSVHKRFDRSKFSFPFWAPTAEFTWPSALRRIGFKLSLWLCCNYDLTRYEEQCVKGVPPQTKAQQAADGRKDQAWTDVRITGEKDAKRKYPWGISGMEVIERDVEDDYPEGELPWFWHLRKFVDRGARCFKLDGANQLGPSKRDWANGRPHAEIKNAYPVIYDKQMGRGYEEYTGRRAMVYSASGYVGVQRYVATWAGDTGGGVGSLMSILNLGVSGHSNQTCDMDIDNPASVHYGVLQPWSQINNWDAWCQPWLYPPEKTAMIRDYIHLRYRLIPYLYGTAANASRTGWPAMRMLPFAYPENPAYDKVPNTYMLGDSLLVSVFTNRTEIPPGTWYDWRTDKPVTGPCTRTEELTDSWGGGLYVKAGGIVPTWPKKSHIEKGWNEEVIVEAWPGADGAAELYEDDGDSLDYRKGGYALTPLKLTAEGSAVRFTVGRRTGSFAGMPATRRMKVRLHAPFGVVEKDLGEVGADGATVLFPNAGAQALVPAPRSFVLTGGVCRLKDPAADVRFTKDASLPAEGYRLEVREDEVAVASSDDAGAFYALQTLRQLGRSKVPCLKIEDAPAFGWRGFMLDEGRHFFGKETVKRCLDQMAAHKLNVFHWHLTEDQGWRLAIDRFPELVKYGAVRPESVAHGCTGVPSRDKANLRTNGEQYGPYFYTAADVKEILAYAAARHIRVVPEIELPGHAKALLAAHPEFSCTGRHPRHPAVLHGVQDEVLCAGNDAAIAYLERVLDYVCELFPSAYVHIGGDECPKGAWKKCPKCQARIKANGLKNEDALQAWVTRHFTDYLAKKGRRAVGWDEVFAGNPGKETVIHAWHIEHEGKFGLLAAEAGYPTIVSDLLRTYFSVPQGVEDDPFTYLSPGMKVSLAQSYDFDPYRGMTPAARKNVIGAECCMWSECTWNLYDLEWKLYPRLCAFAEAVWTAPAAPRDFADFERRMAVHRKRLIKAGVNCAPLK